MRMNTFFIKALYWAAPLAIAGSLVSCSGKKTGEETSAADTAMADTTSAAAPASKTDDFLSSLPSPIHLAKIFNRSGLKYVSGLTHAADKAGQYQSANSKALNLGVYTTDLAYSTFNNQNQQALTYFKSVRTLGDGLQMSSMFESTSLLPRFESNLGNKDSLVYLMGELSLESDVLLQNASRLDVVYLSFAGAFTESMFLATSLIGQNKNLELYNRIVDQDKSLNKLVKLLEEYQENGEFAMVIAGLKDISAKLAKVNETKSAFDSPEFGELTKSIKTFRESITKEV